ncbi:MarR family transcriptional regulator [Pseudomonas sp. NW5]|uniref:MarR family winged helix-turn-helix transcriptional regulator n=1 Tax=Pseudomonas sp. NW5 TaxID=2934934 RepID=UPI002020AC29|nr:MarR family transcriptional regulator [Pseudomonas sp. NW5]MCL7462119.1 MarR family transcriptional regulator [Pseudomonas sp. NW5]
MLDLEEFVPYLLHQAHLSVLRTFEHRLDATGLTLAQWRVLAVLAHHTQVRFGELARLTGQEPSTLVRQLGIMEERGLTRRVASETDRRATYVELDEAGWTLARKILPQAGEVEVQALQGFTADEVEFLRRLLRRIQANAEAQ